MYGSSDSDAQRSKVNEIFEFMFVKVFIWRDFCISNSRDIICAIVCLQGTKTFLFNVEIIFLNDRFSTTKNGCKSSTVTFKNGQMFDSFQYFLNFQYDIISNKSENLHI